MIDLANIRSLSDFQRNTKKHIDRLKKTGKPEVLTINGQAQIVVQSTDAYQELMRDAELARSVQILRERLAEPAARRKGISSRHVLAEIRRRLGLGETGEKISRRV